MKSFKQKNQPKYNDLAKIVKGFYIGKIGHVVFKSKYTRNSYGILLQNITTEIDDIKCEVFNIKEFEIIN